MGQALTLSTAIRSGFNLRRVWLPMVVACLNLATWSRTASARDLPRLICDEPEYCFGTLANTNDVPHTFVLANEGEAPLVIYRVQTDCGCARVRLKDWIVQPGGQTTVQVWLMLKGRAGGQHKRILIKSNDPDGPWLTLSLIGEAVAEVAVDPERVYWGNLRSDAADNKTVDVRFEESAPGRITGIGVNAPGFVVNLETNKPGRNYRVRIRSVPPLALGRFVTNLWITTDSPRYPQLVVPMLGRVVGDIYAVPDELWLEGNATQAVSRLIMVQSSCKRNFKIVGVNAPLPDMEVAVRASLFRGCRIELKNLRPLPELDGRTLTITTDCATMPELNVPFRIGRSP